MPPAPEQPASPDDDSRDQTMQRPARLVLTRRGRLVRTILCAIALLVAIILVIQIVRAISAPEDGSGATPATTGAATNAASGGAASDGGGASDSGGVEVEGGEMDPEALADDPEAAAEQEGLRVTKSGIIRSDAEGDGEFTTAEVAEVEKPEAATTRTYLVRVEKGIDLDPDEVADEVARILADERGWHDQHDVNFRQVKKEENADFILTVASPPTTDEMCLPAKTMGIWSCRVGEDVVLNSDRWMYRTPTYDDTDDYRAYMVNHEVGHFLGHGHESCGGKGEKAPVMMQQSMGLDGCAPNPWPTHDGES